MTEFKSCDDLTELDQKASEYSDVYKDVNDFRPRHSGNWTVEQYNAELERLYIQLTNKMLEEAVEQDRNAAEFELALSKLIAMGANDRQTAIRWMIDDEPYGTDYLEYENGLPYGYLRQMFS